jgi:hypothetical protein
MDWEEESKKMGEVYGNSKVTLAALKSEDGHGGCFMENDKIVHYRHPGLQTTIAIHTFNRYRGYYSCFAGVYHTKDKPLFHRAGTLQEAPFAPRVLHFGSKQFAFQCRRLLCCQCERVVEVVTGGDTPKQGYEQVRLGSSDLNQVLESWADIINQYSTRRLTVETNVFPALSGLVKAFLDRGLGDFVAGVWTDNLPLWLTWKSSAPTAARNKYVCSVMAVGSRLKATSDIAY